MNSLFVLVREGIIQAIQPMSLLSMLMGTVMGIIVGAIPGFTATMAIGILLPITFFMPPLPSLIFLTSIYIAGIYGGSITAIVLNTPGSPESSATTFDGYQMTLKGKASEALGIAIGASATGGLISYFAMLFFMLPVATLALKFGPAEMFLLSVFGIIILSVIGQGSMIKTLLAGSFGLLIGTIGIVPTGEWRGTFGSIYLAEGVQILPAIIGLFALAELISMINREYVADMQEPERKSLKKMIKGIYTSFKYPFITIRSAIIGIIIGAIPAAGATLSAFTAYAEAKRTSKHPEKFGTGYAGGIVAAETANNACTGGAFMTTLALGVPGSTACAVLMGGLMLQGLRPGPQLVRTQIDLVYGLILAAIISQVIMISLALLAGYFSVGLLNVHTKYLIPIICVFCVAGTFAMRRALFDVWLLVAFGVLGWLMKEYGYPPAAMVLGIVLGPIADNELIRTFLRYGDNWYMAFFTRPISLIFVLIIVVLIVRQLKIELNSKNRVVTS